ncbi:MAG: hypothetical protein ACLQUY_24330 [Ktedonobacterales bacterium]
MTIQSITKHLSKLSKRLWLPAAIAALALGMVVPLTAVAAPASSSQRTATSCDGNLSCLISWGDARIAERLTALNALSGKVNDRLSDHTITSDQADAIQSDVTTNVSNLTALKAKIDADTKAVQALADDKSIFVTFRIFAAVLPHDTRLLFFDIMQNLEAKMNSLVPLLQEAVAGATTNKSQLQSLLTDYQSQLAAAEAQFDAINSDLMQITPANFNSNQSSFESTLSSLRGAEAAAEKDLRSAASDLHQMVLLAKAG